jgi:hypothetical protein
MATLTIRLKAEWRMAKVVITIIQPSFWLLKARHNHPGCHHLTGSLTLADAADTAPVHGHHEEGLLILAAQSAGEAASVEVDPLQDLTTFTHSGTTLVGNIGVPNGAFGVKANAVRVIFA